jgi:HK97 family phage prohead protease
MEIRRIEADIEVRNGEFVISTAGVDRHGTIISPDGWDLANFRQNPIMAYQHNTNSTDPDDILGTWEIRVENGQLVGTPNFEPADINPKAEKVRAKVDHGTLRAVSVGFIPRKYHWGDKAKGERSDVLYLDENELLEVSIVAVPSNPDALKRSIQDIREAIPKPTEPEIETYSRTNAKARLSILNLQNQTR